MLELVLDKINVQDLGKKNYNDSLNLQLELLSKRKKDEINDTLLLVEHNPTITLGRDKKWNVVHYGENEIKKLGVDFFEDTPRGGGAAYLGPGQIIGYLIMDITKQGIYNFLRSLEDVMIRTCDDFGIKIDKVDSMNPTTDKLYRATWFNSNGKYKVLCTKGIGVIA